MSTAIDFKKKTIAIITGASRGIGQKIAEELSNKLCSNSKLLLVARSESGLKTTRELIVSANENVVVETFSADLSQPDIVRYNDIFDLSVTKASQYENAIIFHNAGQIGEVSPTVDLTDLSCWRKYYDMNMFSMVLLNSVFVNKLKNVAKRLFVVNVTSLCGHKPFVNLGLYGSVKAARDLFFSVLAIEEPAVTVLKYSPGPVETDMYHELVDNAKNEELKVQMKSTEALTTTQTVTKLIAILENGRFKSGDLIDYFDVVPQ